jgi:hypothetical protein
MAIAYGRIFWQLPEFWLRSLPVLMREGAKTKASAPKVRMPALAVEQRRARIQPTDVQHEVANSHEVALGLRLENAASVTFSHEPPSRVVIGYRWYDGKGRVRLQGPAIPLPGRLAPGRSAACLVNVLTPSDPGDYSLRIALAQEDVGWFDDRPAEFSCWLRVEVRRYGWSDLP